MNVRLYFIVCLWITLCSLNNGNTQPPVLKQKDYEADFDYLWVEFQNHYAYFNQKATNWSKVKDIYRPQLANVKSRNGLIAVLENVLEELYDHHTVLNTNTMSSPRLVPAGADIWAQWKGNRAIVTQVLADSNAERAGVKAGMEVVSINGVRTDKAVNERLGKSLRSVDAAAKDYVLRLLLAGRHNEARHIEVRAGEVLRVLNINDSQEQGRPRGKAQPLLDQKRIGEKPGIGYIRLNNSLGDTDVIKAFDSALTELKDTRGLILDLRDIPNGGNTVVARAIMGRFIDKEAFYQKHSEPSEERETGIKRSWVELVSPREPCYREPVIVLVDHWTASMGEGLAIGMDAIKRGQIVGTEMAGHIGAVNTITLPNSKINVSFPAEKMFHVNGTPREDFVPPVYVDLLNPENQKAKDPILEAGLRALKALIK